MSLAATEHPRLVDDHVELLIFVDELFEVVVALNFRGGSSTGRGER